jgi:asparagine synthase (glutamine-hydrolysing)
MMCGVVGYLHFDGRPASEVILHRMTDAIAHRGPDGEGRYVEGSLAIGHRRLAVIDPSPAGHQPMMSADGRYVMSYNGEAYNFQELRVELEARGHHFRSDTDTEVVLNGFVEWGIESVRRLNGMFAFALWDRQERELWLARDRYGIKPLYTYRTGDTLMFGSEVKAFQPHPEYRFEVDTEGLIEYFTFQNFFTERTLYRDVRLIPAGHWMKVTVDGSFCERQYWDFSFEEHEIGWDEAKEEVGRLFQQAVSRQLVADVPLGVYLSGGIDSGSIATVAASTIPGMTSFTVGFDLRSASGIELRFDERQNAEHLSYLAGTEHYEMVLKAGDMERCMSKLVWHLEEPRVGQSYPNYYASRLASKFVKVIQAGIGGDELFGGYPWRYYRTAASETFDEYINEYYRYWQRLIPNRKLWQVFAPIAGRTRHVWTEDIFRRVFKNPPSGRLAANDYVNLSLYLEAKTFMHGLLVVEDKLSMAYGLEARVPFLDNDLVDFVQRLPVRYKLRDVDQSIGLDENLPSHKPETYFQQTHDGKLLLREVLNGILPRKFLEARKQGFSAPDASWFKGESIDYVRDRLFNPRARIYDFMDPVPVRALLDDHLTGKTNRRLLIWSLLYFEQWLESFSCGTDVDAAGCRGGA